MQGIVSQQALPVMDGLGIIGLSLQEPDQLLQRSNESLGQLLPRGQKPVIVATGQQRATV